MTRKDNTEYHNGYRDYINNVKENPYIDTRLVDSRYSRWSAGWTAAEQESIVRQRQTIENIWRAIDPESRDNGTLCATEAEWAFFQALLDY